LFVSGKFVDSPWLRDAAAGTMVGIGGAVRTLARLDRGAVAKRKDLRGASLSADALERLVNSLAGMSIETLLALPGMKPGRVDMALFGAIIVRELMLAAGATTLLVSDSSIREGIAYEALA
jgi:exopolyphosphatase/guanosine-5'-triphosphate,3'-diphosphate pyrophosphatase